MLPAAEQAVANARSLRVWQTIKRTVRPVNPVVVLWGGSKTARPAKPVAVGDATVAYGLHAARSWIEGIKRQPKIAPADNIDTLVQDLQAYMTMRRDRDPTLLPPPSFDRAIWASLATVTAFTVTVLGCLEASTTSRSWWLGLGASCGALAIWLVVYRRWSAIRVPAIGGLLGVMTVSTLAAVAAGHSRPSLDPSPMCHSSGALSRAIPVVRRGHDRVGSARIQICQVTSGDA